MKSRALEKMIVCDDSNNPPFVANDGKLVITVFVRTQPGVNHHVFDLPIDLEALDAGTLTSVPVEGRGK